MGVEIIAFNGEDHYSAGGQMDYLSRYGRELSKIALFCRTWMILAIRRGRPSFLFSYACPQPLEKKVEKVFQQFDGLIRGDPVVPG